MPMRVFLGYALFCSIFLSACSASRPTAHVIINNESGLEIPINLAIAQKDNAGTRELMSHTLKPGIQQVGMRKLKKGAYSIEIKANNGLVQLKQPLALDTDRWILITYTQADSINIQKKYGYVDTVALKKINGQFAGLDMYIDNRRPPNL